MSWPSSEITSTIGATAFAGNAGERLAASPQLSQPSHPDGEAIRINDHAIPPV